MIEQNYLSAGRTRRTQQLFEKWAEKSNENVVAGPGFEPDDASTSIDYQRLSIQEIRGLGSRKVG